jgi:hypothetical protein
VGQLLLCSAEGCRYVCINGKLSVALRHYVQAVGYQITHANLPRLNIPVVSSRFGSPKTKLHEAATGCFRFPQIPPDHYPKRL